MRLLFHTLFSKSRKILRGSQSDGLHSHTIPKLHVSLNSKLGLYSRKYIVEKHQTAVLYLFHCLLQKHVCVACHHSLDDVNQISVINTFGFSFEVHPNIMWPILYFSPYRFRSNVTYLKLTMKAFRDKVTDRIRNWNKISLRCLRK